MECGNRTERWNLGESVTQGKGTEEVAGERRGLTQEHSRHWSLDLE